MADVEGRNLAPHQCSFTIFETDHQNCTCTCCSLAPESLLPCIQDESYTRIYPCTSVSPSSAHESTLVANMIPGSEWHNDKLAPSSYCGTDCWSSIETNCGPVAEPPPNSIGKSLDPLPCNVHLGRSCQCHNEMDRVLCALAAGCCQSGKVGPDEASSTPCHHHVPNTGPKLSPLGSRPQGLSVASGRREWHAFVDDEDDYKENDDVGIEEAVMPTPLSEPSLEVQNVEEHTRLKREARAFQPARPLDSRIYAVIQAMYYVLVSSIPALNLKIETDQQDATSAVLSVDLRDHPLVAANAPEILKLMKSALENVVNMLGTLSLLDSSLTEVAFGHKLQAFVVCWPVSSQNKMCWDLFRKGSCPRGELCRWYHPQPSEITSLTTLLIH